MPSCDDTFESWTASLGDEFARSRLCQLLASAQSLLTSQPQETPNAAQESPSVHPPIHQIDWSLASVAELALTPTVMTACGFTVVPRSVEEWGVAPASGEWPAYGFKHPELVCKNRSGGPTVVHRLRSVAQFPPFLTLCLGACWGCTIEKTEDCSVDWVKGRVGGGLLPPRAKAQKRHLPGQEGSAAEAVVPDSSDNDGPRVGPADHTDVVPETPRKKQKGEDTTQNDHREGRQDNRSRPRPSMTLEQVEPRTLLSNFINGMTQQLDLGREVLAVLPRADLAPGRSELLKMAKLRVDIKDVQVELQSTKDALSEARSKVSSLQQKLEASDSRALAAERLNKHWEDAMRELLADHGVEAPDRVGPELAVLLSRRQ